MKRIVLLAAMAIAFTLAPLALWPRPSHAPAAVGVGVAIAVVASAVVIVIGARRGGPQRAPDPAAVEHLHLCVHW